MPRWLYPSTMGAPPTKTAFEGLTNGIAYLTPYGKGRPQ
jgi:hypothetical protein